MPLIVKRYNGTEQQQPSNRINDVGVNAAFLQEIKDDECHVATILCEVMRALDVDRINGAQVGETLAVLRRLYDIVKYRFHLEEALGYMEGVISAAPRLVRQAETLRAEHQPLLDQLQQLVEVAHAQWSDRCDRIELLPVRELFLTFQKQFNAHESRENDLIIDSLYFDIGGGD